MEYPMLIYAIKTYCPQTVVHEEGSQTNSAANDSSILQPQKNQTESVHPTTKTEIVYDPKCIQDTLTFFVREFLSINPGQSVLFSTLYAVTSAVGIIGNLLIIAAVVRKRKMRTSKNILIANLAISNLFLSMILYPLLWIPDRTRYFPYERFLCKISAAFPGSNIYCSTLTIMAMAIERYYSVRFVIRRTGTSLNSGRRESYWIIFLCLCIWIASMSLSLPLLILYDFISHPRQMERILITGGEWRDYSFKYCQLAPQYTADEFQRLSMSINALQSSFLYFIPSLVIVVFNFKLSRFVSKNTFQKPPSSPNHQPLTTAMNNNVISGSLSVNHTNNNNNNNNNKTPTTIAMEDCSAMFVSEYRTSTASSVHHKKNSMRTTGGRKKPVKRKSRLRVLLLVMAISYALLWLPYTIYVILIDFAVIQGQTNIWLDFTVKFVSMLSVCINPFVYGYLNLNFRPEIVEIIMLCVPCSKRSTFRQIRDKMSTMTSCAVTTPSLNHTPKLLHQITSSGRLIRKINNRNKGETAGVNDKNLNSRSEDSDWNSDDFERCMEDSVALVDGGDDAATNPKNILCFPGNSTAKDGQQIHHQSLVHRSPKNSATVTFSPKLRSLASSAAFKTPAIHQFNSMPSFVTTPSCPSAAFIGITGSSKNIEHGDEYTMIGDDTTIKLLNDGAPATTKRDTSGTSGAAAEFTAILEKKDSGNESLPEATGSSSRSNLSTPTPMMTSSTIQVHSEPTSSTMLPSNAKNNQQLTPRSKLSLTLLPIIADPSGGGDRRALEETRIDSGLNLPMTPIDFDDINSNEEHEVLL